MSRLWVFALLVALVATTSPPGEICPPLCPMECTHDKIRDENNCELCECREPPRDFDECPPLCRKLCPWGNVRNENNCDICACRPEPANFEPSSDSVAYW